MRRGREGMSKMGNWQRGKAMCHNMSCQRAKDATDCLWKQCLPSPQFVWPWTCCKCWNNVKWHGATMLQHGWVELGALAGVMEGWGGGMMGCWVVPLCGRTCTTILVPKVNVNSTIKVTLAIWHTLQASHFIGPLFEVFLLLHSIWVQVEVGESWRCQSRKSRNIMGPKSNVRLFGTASKLTQHGKLAWWKSTAEQLPVNCL